MDRFWTGQRRKANVGPGIVSAPSESVGWQNFGKMLLVFGCIGTDFLQENMSFAAFFKIYQILKLNFLKFGKIRRKIF